MALALQAATSFLEKDRDLAKPVVVNVAKVADDNAVSLPQIIRKKEVDSDFQNKKPINIPRIDPTPKNIEAQSDKLIQHVPISVGLDKFLQNPQQLSVEVCLLCYILINISYFFFQELNALRDGIIQCLYMIQTSISSSSSITVPSPTPDLISSKDDVQLDLNSELKTTLGLLLKHRGGPGKLFPS
jgi:hypothetical protein